MDILGFPLTHANELWTIVRFYFFNRHSRDITSEEEHPTSGWDRASMRRCWYFLDKTGRSISPFIKELDGELARALCIFYLVLRALDTIEDDMALPNEVKQSLLRNFHIHIVTPGWNFEGSGPNEKDRQLLVEYHNVVEELNLLAPKYKSIVMDITQRVEVGMADYARVAYEDGATIFLTTIADYNLYCHYVGGIPGEGLFRTFSAFGEQSCTVPQLELSNSAAVFLQKLDLIRDYKEDIDKKRYLWPREIWTREEYGFNAIEELHAVVEAGRSTKASTKAEKAMHVQSEMVLDALQHATDTLDFLRIIQNPSAFYFCSRLLCMSFAKLEMSFMNRKVFLGYVKLRRAEYVRIMMRATNLHDAALVYCEYARKIQAKAHISDPHFFQISVACEKIEQWYNYHYPSDGQNGKLAPDYGDARTPIVHLETEHDLRLARKKRLGTNEDAAATAYITTNGGLKSAAAYSMVLLLLVLLFQRAPGMGYEFNLGARNRSVENIGL